MVDTLSTQPPPPFLNNPVPFGNYRMQGGMPHQMALATPGPPAHQKAEPNYHQTGNMNFSTPPKRGMGLAGFELSRRPSVFPKVWPSGHPFGQPQCATSLPPKPSPFAGRTKASPGGRRARQEYQPPSNTFTQEQHVGSPSAVNGNQPNFTQQLARGNSSTPESQHPSPSKPTGNSGHQRAPGLIYPCGAVSVKFAVWACDYCLKNQGYPVLPRGSGQGQSSDAST
uniref:Uncharacterized protein n=1 Tax=Xenopus tropicalis TaxID=8364 RepID=A0A803JAA6_XENTR